MRCIRIHKIIQVNGTIIKQIIRLCVSAKFGVNLITFSSSTIPYPPNYITVYSPKLPSCLLIPRIISNGYPLTIGSICRLKPLGIEIKQVKRFDIRLVGSPSSSCICRSRTSHRSCYKSGMACSIDPSSILLIHTAPKIIMICENSSKGICFPNC